MLADWIDTGNRAIIIAPHQIDDIKELSDYLFVLHDGKMIGHFEKEQLTERYQRYWMMSVFQYTPFLEKYFGIAISLFPSSLKLRSNFFINHHLHWINQKRLDLEETITQREDR